MIISWQICEVLRKTAGRNSSVTRASDSWLKGRSSIPVRGFFFSLKSWLWVLALICCPFHPRVVPGARKRSQALCQKCRCRLNLHTHIPLTKRSRSGLTMLPRHSLGTYQGNELTRNLYWNSRPQSSQLAEPLWTYSCLRGGVGVHELISIQTKQNKQKSAGGE